MSVLKRVCILAAITVAVMTAAWAQQKKVGEELEGQIRQTAFRFYIANLFGDAEEYVKAVRSPLTVVRDGAISSRDEKASRALLTKIAETLKTQKVSDEDRALIIKNAINLFDEASIQFVGSNTATITFMLRPGQKPGEGDSMGTLALYRKDGKWQIISELTDSTPVPPEYLK